MIHQDIIHHRGSRYLWWALSLIVACCVLFLSEGGRESPSGGTWQGYVLGTVGALLIVLLALLGVRKRSYSSTLGTVKGWTAAHVMLGLALLAIATLHCAFQFGWNVHTLTYGLMCMVIGSGIVGLYAYIGLPRRLAANSGGHTRASLFAELYELDKRGRDLCRACDPEVNIAVKSSIERTAIGGGVWQQVAAVDRSYFLAGAAADKSSGLRLLSNRDQAAVVEFVAGRVPQAAKRAEATNLQALVVLLCRRQVVLRQLRRDIQLQAWLKLWLYAHVPLSVALIVALLIHILSTFLYW
jgi:hypothetical protein